MNEDFYGRPLATKALIRSQQSPCGVCGGCNCFEKCLLRILRVYTVSILPPLLHTCLYLHVAPERRINGLETFQKSETEENWIEKGSMFFKHYSFKAIWGKQNVYCEKIQQNCVGKLIFLTLYSCDMKV